MFSFSGAIEICCDAPPYEVVQACEKLGLESPLDVRWCRLSNNAANASSPRAWPWQWFFGKKRSEHRSCSCGRSLPTLFKFAFRFLGDDIPDYRIGQCRHCRSVFWEEG